MRVRPSLRPDGQRRQQQERPLRLQGPLRRDAQGPLLAQDCRRNVGTVASGVELKARGLELKDDALTSVVVAEDAVTRRA